MQPFACRFQFDLPENSGNIDNIKNEEIWVYVEIELNRARVQRWTDGCFMGGGGAFWVHRKLSRAKVCTSLYRKGGCGNGFCPLNFYTLMVEINAKQKINSDRKKYKINASIIQTKNCKKSWEENKQKLREIYK